MAVPESRIADQGRGSMTADADRETWIEQARAVHIEDELARRGIKLNGKVERAGPCPRCGGAVGRYEYQNSDGSFVLNKDGKHKKDFKQKRPDPDNPGKWIKNAKGVRVVLYKLPDVIEAIGNDHSIAIAEGESDCDLLWSWNVPATCNAGGAGKWKPEHSEFLRGADVVIIPDNDDPGATLSIGPGKAAPSNNCMI